MSTNDQPHAEVTEEMRVVGYELAERFIGWPLPKTVCADLVATMHGEANRIGTNLLSFDEAKQMMMEVVVPILIARESLLTASNEDLARQLEEITSKHIAALSILELRAKTIDSMQDNITALAAQVVKLTERAEKAEVALLEIKQRVTADEDFSADEIIELINGLLGRNSISKAWCMEAAHKETMQERDDLRELATRLAQAIQPLLNDGTFIEEFPDEAMRIKQSIADAKKAGLPHARTEN